MTGARRIRELELELDSAVRAGTSEMSSPLRAELAELLAERITARRIQRGKEIFVRVTLPNGDVAQLGGARARRASSAIVCRYKLESSPEVFGLRADPHAAEREAFTLLRSSYRVKGSRMPIPCTPHLWAISVPVRPRGEGPSPSAGPVEASS